MPDSVPSNGKCRVYSARTRMVKESAAVYGAFPRANHRRSTTRTRRSSGPPRSPRRGTPTRACWSSSAAPSFVAAGRSPAASISCARRATTSRASCRRRADRRRPWAGRQLRGFFNVCRHHAAAVVTDARAPPAVRCPYHGWTYALDGALKGTPDFAGVCDFDRSANGLVPLEIATWREVGVRQARAGRPFAGARSSEPDLVRPAFTRSASTTCTGWSARTTRSTATGRCSSTTTSTAAITFRICTGARQRPRLQRATRSRTASASVCSRARWSSEGADERTGAVRQGDRAFYYWIYPNFMINCYGRAMDTNLVIPRGVDKTEVIFD